MRQARGVLLPGGVPPARLAGVGQEDDGAHDAIGKRIAVIVSVVGARDLVAFPIVLIAHKGDG